MHQVVLTGRPSGWGARTRERENRFSRALLGGEGAGGREARSRSHGVVRTTVPPPVHERTEGSGAKVRRFECGS